MTNEDPPIEVLHRFISEASFAESGAVITDLDGTVVHEVEGRALISPSVESGREAICDAGRSVVVNTMRFPLSVIRVFGNEWYRITRREIPLVSLNGSQVGHLKRLPDGQLGFVQVASFVLERSEIDEVLAGVRGRLAAGQDDLLVFFYPEDWRRGEAIWTARNDRRVHVASKYRSASRVICGDADFLEAELHATPLCMIFLLIDAPQDRLMAYQHTESTRFVTHVGVDKRHGADALAQHLGIDLAASIGAGDASADTFLNAVGLAVIVGNQDLKFRGRQGTVRVPSPADFGDLLMAAATALG